MKPDNKPKTIDHCSKTETINDDRIFTELKQIFEIKSCWLYQDIQPLWTLKDHSTCPIIIGFQLCYDFCYDIFDLFQFLTLLITESANKSVFDFGFFICTKIGKKSVKNR